jgi:hypothetical protein
VVPPFSILTQLGSMLSEFLAFFAELASAAITAAVGETTSLVQDAVSLRSFPSKGEAPKLVSTRRLDHFGTLGLWDVAGDFVGEICWGCFHLGTVS